MKIEIVERNQALFEAVINDDIDLLSAAAPADLGAMDGPNILTWRKKGGKTGKELQEELARGERKLPIGCTNFMVKTVHLLLQGAYAMIWSTELLL